LTWNRGFAYIVPNTKGLHDYQDIKILFIYARLEPLLVKVVMYSKYAQ